MTDSKLLIDGFQVFTGDRTLAYDGGDEIIRELQDSAAVMVRLDLDGQTDRVSLDGGQSNDLHALIRARDAITVVIERLERLYAGAGPAVAGRCMEYGGWGRCKARDGHEGPCVMPTEAEWQSLNLPIEVQA